MTDFINELMNDEAVYRTAPATPGLLKIALFWEVIHCPGWSLPKVGR